MKPKSTKKSKNKQFKPQKNKKNRKHSTTKEKLNLKSALENQIFNQLADQNQLKRFSAPFANKKNLPELTTANDAKNAFNAMTTTAHMFITALEHTTTHTSSNSVYTHR